MYAGLGGGELVVLDHIRFLRREGVATTLLLFEDGPLVNRAKAEGASVRVLPFTWGGGKFRSGSRVLRQVVRALELLAGRRHDLVVSYTFNDLILVGLAARFTGVPLVYRAQGDVFGPAAGGGDTWLGRYLPKMMRFLRPRFLPTTAGEAERLQPRGWGPVTTVPLGVRLPEAANQNQAPQLRQNLGWGTNIPIVALFGRLIPWKGQDVFLRALGMLRRQGVNCGAWIVGDAEFGGGDEYVTALNELAIQEGLTDRVNFLRFREDVPALMSASDIVCHASWFEPFGMVIAEAMAAGRPVVASDVSGPREIVAEGETGYLVPPGDFTALAATLGRLISDPDERRRLGQNGAERAREEFEQEHNLQRLHEQCLAAVQGR